MTIIDTGESWIASIAAKGWVVVLIFVVGLGSGVGLGWKLFRPKPIATVETPAPEKRQADNSLILERAPDATAKPAQQIPKGAKVERIERIVVRSSAPGAVTVPTSGSPQPGSAIPALPSTTVDLTLLKMPDDTERVVASSPDGTIVGGVDIPVASAPKEIKNTVIGGYDPFNKSYLSGYLHRFGPFQAGVVGTYSAENHFNGYVTIGVSW